LVARSFASAGVPVTKQPGKDQMASRLFCWDVTVTCPLAESYIDRAALEAGAAAEMAATRKEVIQLIQLQ